jgi:hypothetical protein
MSDINECLKIKLKWEICSTKLQVDDNITNYNYQDRMNECFKFYVKYKQCLKQSLKKGDK